MRLQVRLHMGNLACSWQQQAVLFLRGSTLMADQSSRFLFQSSFWSCYRFPTLSVVASVAGLDVIFEVFQDCPTFRKQCRKSFPRRSYMITCVGAGCLFSSTLRFVGHSVADVQWPYIEYSGMSVTKHAVSYSQRTHTIIKWFELEWTWRSSSCNPLL